jgi:L-cysteine desulfidase
MYGDFPLMSRVMDTVKSIDKMVGKDFKKGLANLKALAEKA